jgi:hypothetical protein
MRNLAIITFILLLNSCANIGTLGGGPIDDKSPILIKSNLTKYNFKDKTITLEFDEFITLNNPEKNIQILPKYFKYKATSTGKKLLIHLDSLPKDGITYNLIISGGVVDNNAGNKFNFNTIYSSNKNIDTSVIKINISNINEYKNIKACLNTNFGKDSFEKFKTDYMLSVDTKEIVYRGISDSSVNLWLYTDKDNDNKPDLYQPINFVKGIKKDSIYNISLENWKKPFRLNKIIRDDNSEYLKIYYDKDENLSEVFKNINIDSKNFILITPEYIITRNNINYSKSLLDSTTKFNFKSDCKNYILNSLQIIKFKNYYTVQYKIPYDSQNYQKNHHLNVIRRIITNKPDTLFVSDLKYSLMDTFDLKNKAVQEEQKLSHLSLVINDTAQNSYDVKIIKNGEYYKTLYNIDSFDEYFEANVYKIEIYKHNYELGFNPFKMEKNIKPIYEKVLYLKASWEEKIVLKI